MKKFLNPKIKESKYLLKIPYSYDKAFDFIEQKKMLKRSLYYWVLHMVFLPEIMEGYNYDNLKHVNEYSRKF